MSETLNLLHKQVLMTLLDKNFFINIIGSVKEKKNLDSSFEWPQESSKKLKLRKMTHSHSLCIRKKWNTELLSCVLKLRNMA